tara:strand:+ start:26710 stop:27339 length:630 start_codon:yes stop_codon:yes gene_type:complete
MNKLLTIALMTISSSLFSQDQVAKEILDKVKAKTESYKNITIDFDFIFENISQNITDTQKGVLILEGDNFRLEMEGQIIINNGETQWVYLKDMNEVQVMEHDPEDEMMSPNKLFMIYEAGYKYSYIGTENNGNKSLYIIDLFPEESGTFMKISLKIDTKKNQLENIKIFDKNGGTYSYKTNTFTTNSSELTPFRFNLSDYPNVEIIDLR